MFLHIFLHGRTLTKSLIYLCGSLNLTAGSLLALHVFTAKKMDAIYSILQLSACKKVKNAFSRKMTSEKCICFMSSKVRNKQRN